MSDSSMNIVSVTVDSCLFFQIPDCQHTVWVHNKEMVKELSYACLGNCMHISTQVLQHLYTQHVYNLYVRRGPADHLVNVHYWGKMCLTSPYSLSIVCVLQWRFKISTCCLTHTHAYTQTHTPLHTKTEWLWLDFLFLQLNYPFRTHPQ